MAKRKPTTNDDAKISDEVIAVMERGPSFPLPEGHYFAQRVVSRKGHHGTTGADRRAIVAIQTLVGVTATGEFDTATGDAVAAWRDSNGLAPDRLVDREAWDLMGLT